MNRPRNDQAAIRAVLHEWAAALGRKDAAAVLAHGTADYVSFSLAPPLEATPSADGLAAWLSTWRGPIGYALHDLAIEAGGDVAFARSLVRLTGTKTDGEAVDLWFRLTLGLRRTEGTWRIAHEHESVPFHMDGSYRAAVDLQPERASPRAAS